MDQLLLLLLLWSSGVQAEGKPISEDPVRLVGGDSHCAGWLELDHKGDWKPLFHADWTIKAAAVVCRNLDCGSAISVEQKQESSNRYVWWITPPCFSFGSEKCVSLFYTTFILDITCSDSVRFLDGPGLCSGRLEVRSNQWWSSVCEADFDQQDAEVVCRELGCGAPSALQGALYGEVEAPVWSTEFQCGGHESALLDCSSSDSARTTCSPGKAVGLTCSEPDVIRLVGGDSRCAGDLELKHESEWKPVGASSWSLNIAAVICRELDCGSVLSSKFRESSGRSVWLLNSACVKSGSALRECVTSSSSASSTLNLNCSDSVRLLDGPGLCSGRLEVRSNQQWSSVCEAGFDQQDAEVVCRELGCGAPSALQGALYGEVEAPVWSTEFQCGGHESALLDCSSSDSARTTCSPGKAVGLTCSEPVRLVGRDSRCAGDLELKHEGEWRPVGGYDWTLKEAAVFCKELDCGSAVSVGGRKLFSDIHVWWIESNCRQSESALRKCNILVGLSSSILSLTCSDSVRLLDGAGLCSGRLEVRSNQRWSSVCEADFDQQDAEVVCRELGCGAPSALQGALYGEVEAPVWSKEFQCGGHESALLDCKSSDSARTTCSPGKAVGLTCSEPDVIRLVGGDSGCAGGLELKHEGEWKPVDGSDWILKEATVMCRELDCGSAVSLEFRESSGRSVWLLNSACVKSGSALRECVKSSSSASLTLNLTCSDSVRLLDGPGLCSGRLEVRSNQRWSSVCEADFDQQDAEVVCRELGCGAPSALQGALYGEVEAPVWSTEFQCGGHESALLDCSSSDSARTTCSPGKAVGLTCSEPDEIRLVGGDSRCAGGPELKHEGEWRPVFASYWRLKEAAVVCKELDCGSAVSVEPFKESSDRPMWKINTDCVQSGSALRECVTTYNYFSFTHNLTCSDILYQPIISVYSVGEVSQAHQQEYQVLRGSTLTISCSIQPQYPGGSFQLTLTSSSSKAEHNYSQPAVNHSAHFLFPAIEPSHQGHYTCVYQVHVFSHNFTSESRLLFVSVSDPTVILFKVVFLPLTLLLLSAALYLYCEVTRGQMSTRQKDTELVNCPLGVGAAVDEGARGAE